MQAIAVALKALFLERIAHISHENSYYSTRKTAISVDIHYSQDSITLLVEISQECTFSIFLWL
jgi:hypothetical protein